MSKIFVFCMTMVFAQYAGAAVTIDIIESGGNVQATLSGNLNMSAVGAFERGVSGFTGFQANIGIVGFSTNTVAIYAIDIGAWTPYGAGGFDNWDSANGDAWAMSGNPFLGLPFGYISQSALSATATKNNSSLVSLGFVPGTYVSTLTNGQFSDTVTVNISLKTAEPIPTISAWGLGILAGLLGIIGMRRRMK